MFDFWKKAKSVACAREAIAPMLTLLRYIPYSPPTKLNDKFWSDEYFIGFFIILSGTGPIYNLKQNRQIIISLKFLHVYFLN